MTKFFIGYELSEWKKMYSLYVYENDKEPMDITDVLSHFENAVSEISADGVIKLAARLIEAMNKNDGENVVPMVERFLKEVLDNGQ